MLLFSCSSEVTGPDDETVEAGMYPVEVAVTRGLSRALTGNDAWTVGDRIGVEVTSSNGKSSTGVYTVTDAASGTTRAETPAYWQSTGAGSVRAWFPADPVTTDIADQQGDGTGFNARGIDFLASPAKSYAFGSTATLSNFTHLLARVKIVVTDQNGIPFTGVTVRVLSQTGVTFANGTLTPTGGTGSVTAHPDATATAFEALVVPGPIDIQVEAGGKRWVHTPAADAMPTVGTTSTYTVQANDGQLLTNNTLTISDNNEHVLVGNGQTTGQIIIQGSPTVILRNVNIKRDESPIVIESGSPVIVLEGTNRLESTSAYSDGGALWPKESTTVTLRGEGSLEAIGSNYSAGIGGGYGTNAGNIKIESGIITAKGGRGAGIGSGFAKSHCGPITISGGRITATGGDSSAGIGGGSSNGVNIPSSCESITISGGEITATGGDCGSGIGSGEYGTCGAIEISGGTIMANATGDDGAGIGSGYRGSCVSITISNGNVTATGGDCGSGIGSGEYGTCGAIEISGGTIMANATGDYGAGIGSGYRGSCVSITISNGNVTATGVDCGSGIGSGMYGTCGAIEISGGTIMANATGYYGAGIGSGYYGSCVSITISNGNVTATGVDRGGGIGSGGDGTCGVIEISGGTIMANATGNDGAGIGSGYQGTCVSITISGGEVSAKGGSDAAAIGKGYGDKSTDLSITLSNCKIWIPLAGPTWMGENGFVADTYDPDVTNPEALEAKNVTIKQLKIEN